MQKDLGKGVEFEQEKRGRVVGGFGGGRGVGGVKEEVCVWVKSYWKKMGILQVGLIMWED